MKYFVIGALLAALGFAVQNGIASEHPGKMIMKNPVVTVVIHTAPCDSEVVKARIDPDWIDQWHKAEITYEGRLIGGCFSITQDQFGNTVVLIVDEDGDAGFLPLEEFKPYDDAAI